MLIPATEALPEIIIGGTWEIQIQLFEDEAHTKPFNLEGWTEILNLEGHKELKSGVGLTITPTEGLIVAVLSVAETTALTEIRFNTAKYGSINYFLSLTKSGVTNFPLRGEIPVLSP